MDPAPKPNLLQQLLQRKAAARKAGSHSGIIGSADLSRQFRPGEKPQPIIRRGGRNGSGKP